MNKLSIIKETGTIEKASTKAKQEIFTTFPLENTDFLHLPTDKGVFVEV